jgi:hypothetical protein
MKEKHNIWTESNAIATDFSDVEHAKIMVTTTTVDETSLTINL